LREFRHSGSDRYPRQFLGVATAPLWSFFTYSRCAIRQFDLRAFTRRRKMRQLLDLRRRDIRPRLLHHLPRVSDPPQQRLLECKTPLRMARCRTCWDLAHQFRREAHSDSFLDSDVLDECCVSRTGRAVNSAQAVSRGGCHSQSQRIARKRAGIRSGGLDRCVCSHSTYLRDRNHRFPT